MVACSGPNSDLKAKLYEHVSKIPVMHMKPYWNTWQPRITACTTGAFELLTKIPQKALNKKFSHNKFSKPKCVYSMI